MPSFLRAAAKTLSKAAGPLGAPLEGVISLLDDERAEKRTREVVERIADCEHNLSAKIDGIVGELDANEETLAEVRILLKSVLQAILQDPVRHRMIVEQYCQEADEDAFTAAFLPLSTEQQIQAILENQVVTYDAVLRALGDFHADVEEFRRIVERAGFPKGRLSMFMPPEAVRRAFMEVFESEACTPQIRASVCAAIVQRLPGSEVLRRWAALYR